MPQFAGDNVSLEIFQIYGEDLSLYGASEENQTGFLDRNCRFLRGSVAIYRKRCHCLAYQNPAARALEAAFPEYIEVTNDPLRQGGRSFLQLPGKIQILTFMVEPVLVDQGSTRFTACD